MSYAIEAEQLAKSFGDFSAVSGIDLKIKAGSVFGLLGPNGAGKTTTVRMLSTLLTPSSGTAKVLGFNLLKQASKVREKVSLTGQFASVDEDLTGLENLVLVARLRGFGWRAARERAQQLLQAFDLADAAKRQALSYSGGMRRRLDIAASLIVRPEILFLDEPTTGLDPRSRNQVWDIVRMIAQQGTTVLLTTQYLEEADQLAERLAVIDQGALIAEGTSRELKASVGSGALHINFAQDEDKSRALSLFEAEPTLNQNFEIVAGEIKAQVASSFEAADILQLLKKNNISFTEFRLASPSLDEVFFALTGKTANPKIKPEQDSEVAQ